MTEEKKTGLKEKKWNQKVAVVDGNAGAHIANSTQFSVRELANKIRELGVRVNK